MTNEYDIEKLIMFGIHTIDSTQIHFSYRAMDVNGLIGYIGGYIGLFVGYSILQMPDTMLMLIRYCRNCYSKISNKKIISTTKDHCKS